MNHELRAKKLSMELNDRPKTAVPPREGERENRVGCMPASLPSSETSLPGGHCLAYWKSGVEWRAQLGGSGTAKRPTQGTYMASKPCSRFEATDSRRLLLLPLLSLGRLFLSAPYRDLPFSFCIP